MNIYKEFCAKNPDVKDLAKATRQKKIHDRRDNYACLLMAEKAKEAAKIYLDAMKLEKAMYYYSKASRWTANANDSSWETIDNEIARIAGLFNP